MSWSFEFVSPSVEEAKAAARKFGQQGENNAPGVLAALQALEGFVDVPETMI